MVNKCKRGEVFDSYEKNCISQSKFFDKKIIGTTWDIKKDRVNSVRNELKYAKADKDKDRVEYWTASINIRKRMRSFLDEEWKANKNKVKNREDFTTYIQIPAEKKMEKHFGKSNHDLHVGSFGDELIKKCQNKC